MKLKVLSRYSSGAGEFRKGQTIDVDETMAAFLQRDSPGSFEVVKPEKATETTVSGIEAHDRRQRGGNVR